MPQSFVQYAADGKNYSVPFQFINRNHVRVTVDGADASFSWLSDNVITLDTSPVGKTVVEVRRLTPSDNRLVDFVDGSTLTEGDLDLSATQALYLAQETKDVADAAVGLDVFGVTFDFLGLRATRMGDPINPQDGANRRWTEGVVDAVDTRLQQTIVETTTGLAAKTIFVFVEVDPSAVDPSKKSYFIHNQNEPASTWVVKHNLNTYPKPTVYDSAGKFTIAEFTFSTLNEMHITFSEPTSGVAYVS